MFIALLSGIGAGQIDLNNFTWAPGYGPDSFSFPPPVGASGDAAMRMGNLNVSALQKPCFFTEMNFNPSKFVRYV